MANSFLELCERSFTGPKVQKEEFDFSYVVMTVQKLVEKYQLQWDPQDLIPRDEKLLRDIFAAARELILETGILNISTSRIMELTEEEIDRGLKEMKRSLVMGEGRDAYTLLARSIEDISPPAIWGGNPGAPTPERLFKPILQSVAKEPVVDLFTCGSLIDVDGHDVRKGEPTELFAVKRETRYVREALAEAGRPGMGILGAESSISEVGDLSALHPDLLRPCDSHLIALFNELIIDRDNLVRVASSVEYGIRNASLACTMVGGFGGDAPGSTLLMIASIMAANVVCRADYHLCHPIHISSISTSARSCLWLQSVLCQSFALNAPSIIVCDIWPKSGALTKELLYEVAASAILVTISGGHLEGVGAVDGNKPHGTGLEVRLMGEVGKAVAAQGMKRQEANAIVLQLLEKYEHVFDMADGNPGKPFDEAYDMETIEPVPEWEAMYREVKRELAGMGIDFSSVHHTGGK